MDETIKRTHTEIPTHVEKTRFFKVRGRKIDGPSKTPIMMMTRKKKKKKKKTEGNGGKKEEKIQF